MLVFSPQIYFSLLQSIITITSEKRFQLDNPKVTQLNFIQNDFSKQYNLRQFT